MFTIVKGSNHHDGQRGDTLVEVMLAIAVLGVVVVGCMSIMNRSNRNILDAIERTAVRTDINSQTEMLNYARDHHAISTLWNNIKSRSVTNANSIGGSCQKNSNSFYLYRSGGSVVMKYGSDILDASSSRAVPGKGLWVDAVIVEANNEVPYLDFYIKACWTRLGSNVKASSSTVVRLYDVR